MTVRYVIAKTLAELEQKVNEVMVPGAQLGTFVVLEWDYIQVITLP